MQPPRARLSNDERTQATSAALISAARLLFVEKGYANTGTPEIVMKAGVTRGALYHHFRDKAELFFAVARQAAEEVAAEIAAGSENHATPLAALVAGAHAYFKAMAEHGRARLLLLDAPSILTPAHVSELSDIAGSGELHEGLVALMQTGTTDDERPIDELTALLSASFDRAALAIANGAPEAPYRSAIVLLLKGLAA